MNIEKWTNIFNEGWKFYESISMRGAKFDRILLVNSNYNVYGFFDIEGNENRSPYLRGVKKTLLVESIEDNLDIIRFIYNFRYKNKMRLEITSSILDGNILEVICDKEASKIKYNCPRLEEIPQFIEESDISFARDIIMEYTENTLYDDLIKAIGE